MNEKKLNADPYGYVMARIEKSLQAIPQDAYQNMSQLEVNYLARIQRVVEDQRWADQRA